MREHVDEREVRGCAQGVIERDGAHGHADADALRPLGDGGGVDLRGGDKTVGREEMLGDPHLVVTELLGQLEKVKILIEALHHAGEIWDLAQAKDPKLRLGHAVPPRQ